MIIELKNCSLDIAYIGTREQIELQERWIEYNAALQTAALELGKAIRIGLADAFEECARAFCRISKNMRSGLE